jgi:hypothetical protein
MSLALFEEQTTTTEQTNTLEQGPSLAPQPRVSTIPDIPTDFDALGESWDIKTPDFAEQVR